MDPNAERTYVRPHRPFPIRVFNAVGQQFRQWGWRTRLSVDAILNTASRQTGLSDWGDRRFVEPLRRLLDSLEDDARLTPFGRTVVGRFLTHFARNRLQIQDALRRHPEILQEPICRPLIVVGLPRTGTTLLHNLLCQNPHCRPLRFYEALYPVPRAGVAPGQPDPRIKRAAGIVKFLHQWGAPQLETIHAMSAESPEECTLLLFNTFATPALGLFGNVTGYIDWLRSRGPEDRLGDYEEHRRQLQLIQWSSGGEAGHWVLKAPVHLFGLDTLLTRYPDACVVQTHRDPCQVIPSACSLFAVSVGIFSDDLTPEQIGTQVAQGTWRDMLEPAMRARAAHPGRVFDVQYGDVMKDPVGTVRSIYQHFGYATNPAMEDGIRRWLADNPAQKHGAHRYDLEQFGLRREELDALFEPYRRQFGVGSERTLVPATRPSAALLESARSEPDASARDEDNPR